MAIPPHFMKGKKGKVIATKEALQLVAYIQSLKQAPLPEGTKPKEFLYNKQGEVVKDILSKKDGTPDMNGKTLYTANCQNCHQENGAGLPGAFPPLKGSNVVTGDNLELYVDIIMNGYDARADYGVMAAVGNNMKFTEKEVAAIINYERTSWGNTGKQVTPEEIKKIMDFVKTKVDRKDLEEQILKKMP